MSTWPCKVFCLLGMGKLSISGRIKGEKSGAGEVETEKSQRINKTIIQRSLSALLSPTEPQILNIFPFFCSINYQIGTKLPTHVLLFVYF